VWCACYVSDGVVAVFRLCPGRLKNMSLPTLPAVGRPTQLLCLSSCVTGMEVRPHLLGVAALACYSMLKEVQLVQKGASILVKHRHVI
jgi:hypothetical protein